jgi:uncharacterized FlgJ-related protein
MNLTELYNLADNNNIDIENWKMKKTKARIISNEDTCIFVDYSQIHSYIEEKEILAEELGHYKYEAYYTLLDDKNFIDKQEYKAEKWKALNLCPLKSILSLFKERNNKLYRYSGKIANNTKNCSICYIILL